MRTDAGCIEYTGYAIPSGYGTISWNGRTWVVHRAMWTALVGPIPDDDDWTIDHLCFNRRCVNVGHLEVVTRTENSLRAGGLRRAQEINAERVARRTECANGHPVTDENSYWSASGKRMCRQCKRDNWNKQRPQQCQAPP